MTKLVNRSTIKKIAYDFLFLSFFPVNPQILEAILAAIFDSEQVQYNTLNKTYLL